ncbi:MAG: hypothetical protein HY943_18010 [Gammaproteobacteria bacterium]|nr:hypothetical protein [Gammaproteobacteria bacterium]
MALTPTGVFSRPNFKLRSMLAQCATVQSLLRGSTAAAALAVILDEGEEGEWERPFIYVTSPEDSPQVLAGGTRTYFKPHGRISAHIEIPRVWTGEITGQTDASNFADANQNNRANDFFNGLNLRMETGARDGEERSILDFVGASGAFVLASALSGAVAIGDQYSILPDSEADAHIFFKNLIGAIRSELLALSGLGTADALDPDGMGYLALQSIRIADWGESLDDKEDARYFGAQIEAEFGV